MPFDPTGFLSVARKLDRPGQTPGPTEAEVRTSCGRSYYSAFLVAEARLAVLGHEKPSHHEGGRHQWLLGKLKGAMEEDVRVLGRRLASIYASRIDADYRTDVQLPFVAGFGHTLAVRAEQWISDFKKVPDALLKSSIRRY